MTILGSVVVDMLMVREQGEVADDEIDDDDVFSIIELTPFIEPIDSIEK